MSVFLHFLISFTSMRDFLKRSICIPVYQWHSGWRRNTSRRTMQRSRLASRTSRTPSTPSCSSRRRRVEPLVVIKTALTTSYCRSSTGRQSRWKCWRTRPTTSLSAWATSTTASATQPRWVLRWVHLLPSASIGKACGLHVAHNRVTLPFRSLIICARSDGIEKMWSQI